MTYDEIADKIAALTEQDRDSILALAAEVRGNIHYWQPSVEHPGYLTCPNCHNCYIEQEWVTDLKWGNCPSCGEPLKLQGDYTNE